MKKIFTRIIVSSFFVLVSIYTMAQKETKTFSAGFGLEAGVPTGNLSNVYSFSGGLTVRGSYHVGQGFVTLTTGVIGYAPKTAVGVPKKAGLEIPVRAGYKYIIQHHFFVMGELGYASFKSYYGQNGNIVQSSSTGSFIGAPSVGYQWNAFELSLRYGINFTNSNGGDVALRIGFNF
jgi:hypothetical protein